MLNDADEKVPPSVVPPTHDTSLRQRDPKRRYYILRQNGGPQSAPPHKARMSQTNPSRLAAASLLYHHNQSVSVGIQSSFIFQTLFDWSRADIIIFTGLI